MGRAWFAGFCAVLGVLVLAGPGWALLGLAAVIYLTPVPARVRSFAAAARSTTTRVARRSWRWLTSGRHQVAIVLAIAALLLAPMGFGIAFGAGAGIIAAAALVGFGSLLLGWDRPGP